MQLVKTERDNLLRPLQTVSGIVERRHTLPILANLLITKNGADVSFLSTDLEDARRLPTDPAEVLHDERVDDRHEPERKERSD